MHFRGPSTRPFRDQSPLWRGSLKTRRITELPALRVPSSAPSGGPAYRRRLPPTASVGRDQPGSATVTNDPPRLTGPAPSRLSRPWPAPLASRTRPACTHRPRRPPAPYRPPSHRAPHAPGRPPSAEPGRRPCGPHRPHPPPTATPTRPVGRGPPYAPPAPHSAQQRPTHTEPPRNRRNGSGAVPVCGARDAVSGALAVTLPCSGSVLRHRRWTRPAGRPAGPTSPRRGR